MTVRFTIGSRTSSSLAFRSGKKSSIVSDALLAMVEGHTQNRASFLWLATALCKSVMFSPDELVWSSVGVLSNRSIFPVQFLQEPNSSKIKNEVDG